MEDQSNATNSPSQGSERVEPVRSRWTPKPEQILILESIFNSGMVNPPKDETVRIRKLLEKFGSVGDANVFYWFQNRRSRSRRRQRQIQAGLAGDQRIPPSSLSMSAIQSSASSSVGSFASPSSSSSSLPSPSSSSCFVPPPSCVGLGDDVCSDLFSISQQMGLPEIEQAHIGSAMLWPSDDSNLHYQPGLLTVFVNGVATEIPRGPLDIKAMFGQDVILVHSSGEPVLVNEYGISLQSLQMGENYFLACTVKTMANNKYIFSANKDLAFLPNRWDFWRHLYFTAMLPPQTSSKKLWHPQCPFPLCGFQVVHFNL